MGTHWGNEGVVKINGTAVGRLQNWKLDTSVSPISDTSMGDTWETHIPNSGIKKWTGSMDFYWDEADAGQAIVSIGSSVTLALYPEGAQSGDVYFSGTASVTSFGLDIKKDGEPVGRTCSFQGSGALNQQVIP